MKEPFEYRSDISKKKSRMIIGSCWIVAFILGYSVMIWQGENFKEECKIYQIIGDKQLLAYSIIGKILPALSLIAIYGFIFCAIKRVNTILNLLIFFRFLKYLGYKKHEEICKFNKNAR